MVIFSFPDSCFRPFLNNLKGVDCYRLSSLGRHEDLDMSQKRTRVHMYVRRGAVRDWAFGSFMQEQGHGTLEFSNSAASLDKSAALTSQWLSWPPRDQWSSHDHPNGRKPKKKHSCKPGLDMSRRLLTMETQKKKRNEVQTSWLLKFKHTQNIIHCKNPYILR